MMFDIEYSIYNNSKLKFCFMTTRSCDILYGLLVYMDSQRNPSNNQPNLMPIFIKFIAVSEFSSFYHFFYILIRSNTGCLSLCCGDLSYIRYESGYFMWDLQYVLYIGDLHYNVYIWCAKMLGYYHFEWNKVQLYLLRGI